MISNFCVATPESLGVQQETWDDVMRILSAFILLLRLLFYLFSQKIDKRRSFAYDIGKIITQLCYKPTRGLCRRFK